jgi:hypothetical protein
LAADSLGVEKIEEHGFFRLPGAVLGLGQIIQPTDTQGHGDYLLFRNRDQTRLLIFPKIIIPGPKAREGRKA